MISPSPSQAEAIDLASGRKAVFEVEDRKGDAAVKEALDSKLELRPGVSLEYITLPRNH